MIPIFKPYMPENITSGIEGYSLFGQIIIWRERKRI
jgi:hypothetical protein